MTYKARYWSAVLYPENMIQDWEDSIADTIQIPFSYCIHDRDLVKDGDSRKVHVHLLVVFSNTTTENHALSVCNMLSLPGKVCCSTIQRVIEIGNAYRYLIHDTDDSRKKGKFQYSPELRVCGNNFDIGSYEQLSEKEKEDMLEEMEDLILQQDFYNFRQFFVYLKANYERKYVELARKNSGHLERLTRGNYQDFTLKMLHK